LADITPPDNSFSSEYSNILPLIQSGESSSELSNINILNEYNAIEDGTYQYTVPSILSSSPYNMYSNVDSLHGNQIQGTGSYLDSLV
jgi:hypothetical protein